MLARSPGWRDLVLEIRANADWRPSDDAGLAARLRDFGLPETPGTIRHLRAVAAKETRPPLPTRGWLVTTIARTIPPHSSAASGDPDIMNPNFMAKTVSPIMTEHGKFLKRHAGKGVAALESYGGRDRECVDMIRRIVRQFRKGIEPPSHGEVARLVYASHDPELARDASRQCLRRSKLTFADILRAEGWDLPAD